MLELRWSTHFSLWSYIYGCVDVYTIYQNCLSRKERERANERENARRFAKMKWTAATGRTKEYVYLWACVRLLNVFNVMVFSTIEIKKIGKWWWWWSEALANMQQKWIEPKEYVYIRTSDDIFLSTYTCVCVYTKQKQRHTHTELLFNASRFLFWHATSISVSFCSSSVIIYGLKDLNSDGILIDMHASDDRHDQLRISSAYELSFHI